MSNHVHLIVFAKELNRLSDVPRDLKKFTAKRIIKAISENTKESRKSWMMLCLLKKAGEESPRNTDYQFWQQDNHRVECGSAAVLDSKMNYLHENTVKAGVVRKAEDYVYSSAMDYCLDKKRLVEIDYLSGVWRFHPIR